MPETFVFVKQGRKAHLNLIDDRRSKFLASNHLLGGARHQNIGRRCPLLLGLHGKETHLLYYGPIPKNQISCLVLGLFRYYFNLPTVSEFNNFATAASGLSNVFRYLETASL